MKSKQEIVKRNSLPENILIPSKRVITIAEKLVEVNLLINYKMDGEEITTWAAEIDRLMPPEDVRKIPFVLDCFKKEELPYNHNEGIRNFFKAVKMVTVDEEGNFKILKAIW